MKFNVKVEGKDRSFNIRKMETEKNDGQWELLALVTEGEESFPQPVDLLILATGPNQRFVAKLKELINKSGGVSSDEEYRQMLELSAKE